MLPRYVGAFLLGIASRCFVIKLAKPEGIIVKPLGIKLCEHLCNYRGGNTSYVYTVPDLSCCLANAKPDLKTGIYLKDAEKINLGKNTTCRENAEIYHTRSNSFTCGLVKLKQREQQGVPRLLILPKVKKKSVPGKLYYLLNNSTVPYPDVPLSISAVAYIAASKELLVATSKPRQLFFTPLNKWQKRIVSRKLRDVECITVDETKQLVFVASRYTYVYVMTTKGKNLTPVAFPPGYRCFNIALDSKFSMLYALCLHTHGIQDIYQFNYEGKLQKTINQNVGQSLYLDSKLRILYYIERKVDNVYKMSLSDPTYKASKHLPLRARFFYVFGGSFFIRKTDVGGTLKRVGENGDSTYIYTGYSRFVLCGIP